MNQTFGQAAWMILAMTLAAAATIFAKSLTEGIAVVQILWLRLVLGSALLVPFFWASARRPLPAFGWLHAARAVILIGMTGLWFFALKLGPVTHAAVMSYTYPAFILVCAAVFFRHRVGGRDLLSLALSLVGVVVVFGLGWAGTPLGRADLLQMGVVLCSSLLIATRVCVERVMTVSVDPMDILIGSMLIATVVLVPAVVPNWTPVDAGQLFLLAGLALTATLSQLIVIRLIRHGAWSVVSIFAFWEVLAAITLAMAIFGESLALPGIVGAALIILGGALQVGKKV